MTNLLKVWIKGQGGGQVVSVLAFYSDNLSSNPADAYSFFWKNVIETSKNKETEAGLGFWKLIEIKISREGEIFEAEKGPFWRFDASLWWKLNATKNWLK